MTAQEAELLLPVVVDVVKQVVALVEEVQAGKTPATDALTALSKLQQSIAGNSAAADAEVDVKFPKP